MPAPRAVLIGPPGSGKSAVAAALASCWAVAARDTDEDIVTMAGRGIPEIFVEDGEAAFRAMERAAVADALATHGGVLALGGGAILDAGTQDDLERYAGAGGAVVYLCVAADTAARRVGLNAARPLLVGNPRARWVELMNARRGIYERLATVAIETDDLTPDEVAAQIAKEVPAP